MFHGKFFMVKKGLVNKMYGGIGFGKHLFMVICWYTILFIEISMVKHRW